MDTLQRIQDAMLIFLDQEYWLVSLFLVVFATALLTYVAKKAFSKHVKHDHIDPIDPFQLIVIKSAYKPFLAMIWIVGLFLAFWMIKDYATGNVIWTVVPVIKNVAIIMILVWFANRAIKGFQCHYVHKSEKQQTKLDVTSTHAIAQLMKISVLITAALSIMRQFNVDITALLTFGGIGGVGLAFAAKDLLANFFGGFMIFFDRPFEVGDWIRSPDKEIEGTVEYIGWRVTQIRTFDKRPRYVPNNIFLSIVLDNPSRMKNRRIKAQFGLRYDDAAKVNMILKDVESMLRHHVEIDATQTLMVNLIHFGDSSLDILVYTFTKTVNWVKFQAVQQDVFLKILEIVTKHGAQCAYPTRQLITDQPL